MRDLEQLIRSLDGELTEEQKNQLNEELKNNPSLVDNLELIKDVDSLMGDKHLNSFESTLKEVEYVVFKQGNLKKEEVKINRFTFTRLVAASVIAIVSLGILFYFMASNQKQSSEYLYAHYYQKLEADFLTRSATVAQDDFIKAVEFYSQGKYESAIGLFNSIIKKDPSNNAAKLFLGISYTETQRFTNAIKVFQDLIKQDDIMFGEHASWYLSLCYIKLNEVSKAKPLLKHLVTTKSFYVQKASDLLKDLG